MRGGLGVPQPCGGVLTLFPCPVCTRWRPENPHREQGRRGAQEASAQRARAAGERGLLCAPPQGAGPLLHPQHGQPLPEHPLHSGPQQPSCSPTSIWDPQTCPVPPSMTREPPILFQSVSRHPKTSSPRVQEPSSPPSLQWLCTPKAPSSPLAKCSETPKLSLHLQHSLLYP